MGNTIWICDYCKFPNHAETNEICIHCNRSRVTGIVSSHVDKSASTSAAAAAFAAMQTSGSLMLHNRLKRMLVVEKSALRNEKAGKRSSASVDSVFLHGNGMHSTRLDHHVDVEFPPNKKSLFMNGNRIMRNTLIHSTGFSQVKQWLRPKDIFVADDESQLPITLFSNPTPKDVIQGELGTCWFLSALALMAEKPFLLMNTMITQHYNPFGMHQVRLCMRGQWIQITVDDYLPCDKYRQLVFSYGRKRQFWVPIMEKALAKLYGSYEAIAKGACAEGLQTLTGEPCEVLYLQLATTPKSLISSGQNSDYVNNSIVLGQPENDPSRVWRKILFSRSTGYLMTTLCYNENIPHTEIDKVGLLNRHIYSILDAREFINGSEVVRLLRLRNPWGRKEWKGNWSERWPYWPAHIRSQLMQDSLNYMKNDGCFWISLDDVLRYFYDITICKVRANWTESRQSSFFYDYSVGAEVYLITISQPNHQFEIELFATGRKNEGFDRNADPDIDLCLILCRITDPVQGGLTCVAFEHSVEYYVTLSAVLQPGNYLVFATSIKGISPVLVERDPTIANYYSYNIVFHGMSSFGLSRTRLPSTTVADIFYSVAQMQNQYKKEFYGNVRSYVIQGSCTHAIIVENLSSNFWIKSNLNTSTSRNLESTRFSSKSSDLIGPRSRQLLAFLTPLNYRNGYVIGYKLDTQIYTSYADAYESSYPEISGSYKGLHSVRSF